MKPKAIIGVSIALAVLTAGIWFASTRRRPLQKPLAKPSQPEAMPATVAFPSNPVGMITVAGLSERQQRPAFDPSTQGWTDIQVILDTTQAYQRRASAINHLPAKLSDADWQTLKQFLLKKAPSDNEQLGQVLKNLLMDRLCAMSPPPSGLGDVLIRVYGDRLQDSVLRDYALQHVAALHQQLEGGTGNAVVLERQSLQKILWSALAETGTSIAGTALLGLQRLSESEPAIDQNKLAQAALKIALAPSSGELGRITAYQVCAQLGVQDALPTIRAAAQSSPTVSLQISAIGALGNLGVGTDIPMLQDLSDDQRLNTAARHALAQIRGRMKR